MSILIKELHLPSEHLYPLHLTIYSDGSVFCGHGIGKRTYEAAEVTTPHGRLGDMDAIARKIRRFGDYVDFTKDEIAGWFENGDFETIIPAEEETT